MADDGGSVTEERTSPGNGLKRELSISKELQDKIFNELDTLNTKAARINVIEKGLDERRTEVSALEKSFKAFKRRYESQLRKAQPFFRVLAEAKKKQKELQEAAQKFEKASNQLADAKAKEALAEKGLRDSVTGSEQSDTKAIDLAWQEILNNAIIKVVEAEKEKRLFEQIHQAKAGELSVIVQQYNTTERKLRGTIRKVRPYLEERQKCVPRIQELKAQITAGQQELAEAKSKYRQAMKNLETLNEEMHRKQEEQGELQTDYITNMITSGMMYNPNKGSRQLEVSTPLSDDMSGISESVSDLGSINGDTPTPSLLEESMEVVAHCVVESSVGTAVRKVSTDQSSSLLPETSSMIEAISGGLVERAIQGAIDVVSDELSHEAR